MAYGTWERLLNGPLLGIFWFIAISGVLYAIWVWNDGKLGYWGIPTALAVASIPSLVAWALKKLRRAPLP
jgi:hypothetical protein